MKCKKFYISLLALLPAFFALFCSPKVSATESLSAQYFQVQSRPNPSATYSWTTGIQYATNLSNVYSIKAFVVENQSIISSGNYFSGSYKFIIRSSTRNYQSLPPDLSNISVDALRIGSTYATNLTSTVNMVPLGDNIHTLVDVAFAGNIAKNVTGSLVFSVTAKSGDSIIFDQYTSGSGATVGFMSSYSGQYTGGSIDFSDEINYNNTINNVTNSVNSVKSSVEETNNLIKNQTESQQNQYDEEKQEESQREESGNESADEMAGVFSFSIQNPFTALFGAFTSGNTCVNIPTIAAMTNSDNTQYCPWFPDSVRNVLTPVLSMLSMMVIFGFVVKWLNGSGLNGRLRGGED